MRITSKGQVTIPAHIRESAGLLPKVEVDFIQDGEVVRLVRSNKECVAHGGSRIVAHLRGRLPPPVTTDDIMALTRAD